MKAILVAASVSSAEEAYLLAAVSSYLRVPIDPASIVWRYAGVRPLRDDGSGKAQAATRDYVLELDGKPPVLSVFGGKITTYRRLAEAAMAKLAPFFPGMQKAVDGERFATRRRLPMGRAAALQKSLRRRYPFLSRRLSNASCAATAR